MDDKRFNDITRALDAINDNIDKITKQKILEIQKDLENVLIEVKKARDNNPWDPKFKTLNDRVKDTKASLQNNLALRPKIKVPTGKPGYTLDEKAQQLAQQWKETGSWWLTKTAIEEYSKTNHLTLTQKLELISKTQHAALNIIEGRNNNRRPR